MKITVLEKKENYLRMIIEDIDAVFTNSLRRIIIAEVPSLAIDDVWIVENDSPLYDEIIAHRLGLVPLKTDLETYVLPSQCKCEGEGCPQCQVSFTITKEATEDTLTVYSGDLQSEDPAISAAATKIPIVELIRGQKLVLEAYAKLGIGEDHAKWQPVATCTYKYLPIISIDYGTCEKCEKCVDTCPRHILSFQNNQIQIQNPMTCNFCMSCEEACEVTPAKAIHVSWDSSKFIFTIESTGVLPCETIVSKATDILKGKIESFLKILSEI
ncbi:MAG: DNA-directed RNA polymerase subunit D [Candidatus Helarchaeota archaeon]